MSGFTKAITLDSISPATTKGDIIVRSAATNARLAVGADGLLLQAEAAQALGVKWSDILALKKVTAITADGTPDFTGGYGAGNTPNIDNTGRGFALKNAAGVVHAVLARALGDHLNFGNTENARLRLIANNALVATINPSGKWNIGPTEQDPTAFLNIEGSLNASRYSGGIKVIRKTADEIVNNSAVFQDDDHLSFPIAANEVWWLYMMGNVTQGDVTAGWKAKLLGPAGWAPVIDWFANIASASSSTWGTGTQSPSAICTTVTNLVQMRAMIVNGANAGTVQLQWAQEAARGNNTTFKSGSSFLTIRVA